MKKLRWLFGVCMVAVLACFASLDIRAEDTEVDTSVFEYEENEDGTIFISGYNGTDETVTIPAEIDGKTVTGIGVSSFSQCETVRRLIISEGIMDILDNGIYGTFYSCENLETVSLPSTLKTIGGRAFEECHKLREINLPEGLVSIGDDTFFKCYKLSNISLPISLTSIGAYAFAYCGSLEKLIIPDNVTQIDEKAFYLSYDDRIPIYGNPDAYIKTYCDADRKIKFSCINHPNVVIDPAVAPNCKYGGRTEGSHCSVCGTAIVEQQYIRPNGQHTWDDGVILFNPTTESNGEKIYTCTVCHQYKHETIPAITAPKKGDSITNSNVIYKVTNTSRAGSTVEFTATQESGTDITIPSTFKIDGINYKVTSIAKNAFKNNKNLKKVTINGNITKIDANAFRGCTNLKTIIIKSKNLKLVGKNAFKGISPKARIKVPSGKLEQYKKLLAKKGQKPSVKIIK